MGTFTSIRKAYGALKDSTKVGLAKVNSDYKDLDVAIVKATNHVEYPPKERHVRKIFYATSAHQPRADVAYCIHALSKRLSKTRSWIVAIKTLIVIHRILREGDPTFREELLNYTRRGHVLQISNFKDDSSPLAWDCSAWVRTYALFLEERLECFRVLSYDIESGRMRKSSPAMARTPGRARELDSDEMLEKLPALQQLLYRLIGCQPEGAAYSNPLIQYALALVLKESFKIYCAINDGIVTLVDMFFDMPRHDAVKVLNIYKRAGQQAENLAVFYEYCKGLAVARNFQFPNLKQPPPTFLSTMEEYIKEAPQTSSANKRLAYQESDGSPQKEEPEEVKEGEEHEKSEEEASEFNEKKPVEEEEEETRPKEEEADPPPLISTDASDDLLGLDEISPKVQRLEESNALALAIIPPDGNASSTNHSLTNITGTSGWELALVTAPTNNISQTPKDHKMGGGFDKLLLDSLYEDENARRQLQLQNAGYGPRGMVMQNQYNQQESYINNQQNDPFAMSNNIAPPTTVQMAQQQQQQMMFQQQQQQQQQQMMFQQQQQQQQHNMMMKSHGHGQYAQSQYPQHMQLMDYSNPFGDPLPVSGYPHNSMPQQGNYNLI